MPLRREVLDEAASLADPDLRNLAVNDLEAACDAKLKVKRLLAVLSDRERKIIKARFEDNATTADIGADEGVGRERISQIEAKALRKMRGAALRAKMIAPEPQVRRFAPPPRPAPAVRVRDYLWLPPIRTPAPFAPLRTVFATNRSRPMVPVYTVIDDGRTMSLQPAGFA